MKRPRDNSTELPQAFLLKIASLMGDEYDTFLNSLHQPANIGLRVNTLKLSPDEFIKISPFKLSPIPWCSSGFIVDEAVIEPAAAPPGKHPYHNAGLYYLQEPSAMAAAEALSLQAGEKVLDLAAAPGGKSTHFAGIMKNEGMLVANEIHPGRVWDLAENLERCGVTNAIVTNETPQHLADHLEGYFDRVMLDAPCSGEGMFRKSGKARKEWKPELPASCANRQSAILAQAARLVKPGGYLAYTTCTFSPEENEAVINSFLEFHPEFEIQAIHRAPGFQPAKPEWIGLPKGHKLNQAVRLWPHLSCGEGHFMALLMKNGSLTTQPQNSKYERVLSAKKEARVKDKQQAKRIWMDFATTNLAYSFDADDIDIWGTHVYRIPNQAPGLGKFKVIHPGWWLGTIQKDRFIPSHALAMGISGDQARRVIPLESGGQQVSNYLAGESFIHAGEDGWVLVTVDGYPLGWGKSVHGVIKNYYPRGLRRFS